MDHLPSIFSPKHQSVEAFTFFSALFAYSSFSTITFCCLPSYYFISDFLSEFFFSHHDIRHINYNLRYALFQHPHTLHQCQCPSQCLCGFSPTLPPRKFCRQTLRICGHLLVLDFKYWHLRIIQYLSLCFWLTSLIMIPFSSIHVEATCMIFFSFGISILLCVNASFFIQSSNLQHFGYFQILLLLLLL